MTRPPGKEFSPIPDENQFPLYVETQNEDLNQQAYLLWLHGQTYFLIANMESYDPETIIDVTTQMAQFFRNQGNVRREEKTLAKKISENTVPKSEAQEIKRELIGIRNGIQDNMDMYREKHGFNIQSGEKLPPLKDPEQIGSYLHDLGNTTSLMNMIVSINPTGVGRYLGTYRQTLRRVYKSLGQEIEPEASPVSIDQLSGIVNNVAHAYEISDARYQYDYNRHFVKEYENVQFYADIANLEDFVTNIFQNIARSYDELHGKDSHEKRKINVHYDIVTEPGDKRGETVPVIVTYTYLSIEDEGGGFPQELLDLQSFPEGISSFGGAGVGMNTHQKRLELFGARVNLANVHQSDDGTYSGARLTIRFPGSRLPLKS